MINTFAAPAAALLLAQAAALPMAAPAPAGVDPLAWALLLFGAAGITWLAKRSTESGDKMAAMMGEMRDEFRLLRADIKAGREADAEARKADAAQFQLMLHAELRPVVGRVSALKDAVIKLGGEVSDDVTPPGGWTPPDEIATAATSRTRTGSHPALRR